MDNSPISQNALTRRMLNVARRELNADKEQNLQNASQKMEALFATMLLRQMRKAFSPKGFFGEAAGANLFQSLMEQRFGEVIAKRQQLGIAELIQTRLSGSGQEKSPKILSAARLDRLANVASEKTGLASDLILAVIEQESAGDTMAMSSKGAKGLMQLMDGTAQELGVTNPFDPLENVLAGSRYLSDLLQRFKSLPLALAAFNAGPATIEKYGTIPPFKETQQYVKKILSGLELPNQDDTLNQDDL